MESIRSIVSHRRRLAKTLFVPCPVILLFPSVYYAPWWNHVNDYESLKDSICFIAYEDLLTVDRVDVDVGDLSATVWVWSCRTSARQSVVLPLISARRKKWPKNNWINSSSGVRSNQWRTIPKWITIGFVSGVSSTSHSNSFAKVRLLLCLVRRRSPCFGLSVAGEIGDWLNHFDVEQSKAYDDMVSRRVSPSIGRFNYGISSADQQCLYDFHDERQRSSSPPPPSSSS